MFSEVQRVTIKSIVVIWIFVRLIVIENQKQMVKEWFICILLSIHVYSVNNSVHSWDVCVIYLSQHAFLFRKTLKMSIGVIFRIYRYTGWIVYQLYVKLAGENFLNWAFRRKFYWSMVCVVQPGVLVLIFRLLFRSYLNQFKYFNKSVFISNFDRNMYVSEKFI